MFFFTFLLKSKTAWWQLKYFFIFTPKPWGDSLQFDEYFSKGLKPPTTKIVFLYYEDVVCFSDVGDLGGVISQTEIWTAGGQVLYDVDYSTRTCHLVAKAVVVVTQTQKPMVF